MMAAPVTKYTLSRPISGDGFDIRAVAIRRPTPKARAAVQAAIAEAEEAQGAKLGRMGHWTFILGELTDLPPEAVRRLHRADARKLVDLVHAAIERAGL